MAKYELRKLMRFTVAIFAVVFSVYIIGGTFSSASGETILDGLTVTNELRCSKYKRSNWGSGWLSLRGTGLNTREEVLIAESLTKDGMWLGPYNGVILRDASNTDVDHMVPLKEACESGGRDWSTEKKKKYANFQLTPNHLIVTSAGANRSKGARDPAQWMPANKSYWCTYLLDWTDIKRAWGLTVDKAEAAAIKLHWKTCAKFSNGIKTGR
jgi:hypothetical protein|tara:strand:- start:13385 stop:14020 length:636 start_codon:yes stop_codon:yes gene_type:complete